MEARLKNPSLPYAKRFEEGLKAMEEKYQVDIQSRGALSEGVSGNETCS